MNMLESWLILAFAVWATAAILPGIEVRGAVNSLVVAAIFGILGWSIGFMLFVLIGVGTLGLGFLLAFATRWVVNALLLVFTAKLTPRLRIRSFGWALLGAMFMSAIGTFAQYVALGEGAYVF
jgi:putative membrane protein